MRGSLEAQEAPQVWHAHARDDGHESNEDREAVMLNGSLSAFP